MRPHVAIAIVVAIVPVLVSPVPAAAGAPPFDGRDLEVAVEDSVDRGIEWLLRAVEGDGGWAPGGPWASGYAAVQLYALLCAGVSRRHPSLEKGLALLEGMKLERVYSVSISVLAWDAALREDDGAPAPAGVRKGRDPLLARTEAAVLWLLSARMRGVGAWDYRGPARGDPRTHRWDNSNTQFAVLALGVAAARGVKVPVEVWEEVADHFAAVQDPDGEEVRGRPVFRGEARSAGRTVARKGIAEESGKVRARGFRYEKDGVKPATLSMTAAGLSSLILAAANLPPGSLRKGRGDALRAATADAYGWLVANLDRPARPKADPYAFYSLEKVGDLGGVDAFGGFRWYEECARLLLAAQRDDGSWGPPSDPLRRRADTSLALLFLSRATALRARGPSLRATGSAGARAAGAGTGGWIHVPSLGGEVPVARLFRQLRYRPGKGTIRLVEEAVRSLDPRRIDEVILPLVAARDRSPFPEAAAFARETLSALTGIEGDEPAYAAWVARWREAARIGRDSDRAGIPKLREWIRGPDNAALKGMAVWALERTGAREALGDLIDLFLDPDPGLREAAHRAAVFLSGIDLPFHPRGPEPSRRAEAAAWKARHLAETSGG